MSQDKSSPDSNDLQKVIQFEENIKNISAVNFQDMALAELQSEYDATIIPIFAKHKDEANFMSYQNRYETEIKKMISVWNSMQGNQGPNTAVPNQQSWAQLTRQGSRQSANPPQNKKKLDEKQSKVLKELTDKTYKLSQDEIPTQKQVSEDKKLKSDSNDKLEKWREDLEKLAYEVDEFLKNHQDFSIPGKDSTNLKNFRQRTNKRLEDTWKSIRGIDMPAIKTYDEMKKEAAIHVLLEEINNLNSTTKKLENVEKDEKNNMKEKLTSALEKLKGMNLSRQIFNEYNKLIEDSFNNINKSLKP